jgi:hypothetical protein
MPYALCSMLYALCSDHQLFFFNEFADIDEGVAHATEGGIDAHVGEACDFLEGHICIMAKDHYFSLLSRQHIDEDADAIIGLILDHAHLAVWIVAFEDIKDVERLCSGNFGAALGPSELVYAHVVGNPQCPLKELAFVIILAFAEGVDDLDKDILEEVICQLAILGKHVDRRVDLRLVAMQQCGKGGLVSGQIEIN